MGTSELNQLPAGTRIGGRYEILEVIGQGGFGITYRGYDLTLDVPVAVKEYYPSGIASRYHTQSLDVQVGGADNQRQFEEGKAKFLEEARVLAKFSEDPNVVGVRDFFEDNQTVYIVMQYLQGESLKDYTVTDGRMTFDEAFALLRPVMQSLGRMHSTGLIHRDISPSNLIRMRSGKVKLIDFGTAREISAEGEKSLSVMLKPGYAPAEQYKTRGAQGPWTDVYALCASIYKLITGVTPENSLNRLLEDELLPPSQCGAVISPSQEEALMRGLAVRAGDRIQNMEELEAAFDAASAVPEQEQDGAGEYDDERTIMGPSAEAFSQKKERTHEIPAPVQKKASTPARKKVHEKPAPVEEQIVSDVTGDGEGKKAGSGAEQKQAGSGAEQKQAGAGADEKQAGSRAEQRQQKKGKFKEKEQKRKIRQTKKELPEKEKSGRPRKKWPILAVILAVAAVIAVVYFSTNGSGGGEIADWGDDKKIVRFVTDGKGTTITKSALNAVDRNHDVVAIQFYNCNISDEVIERLGSMKRIEEVKFDGCAGFSTLSPLSGLQTLTTLEIEPAIGEKDPVFDGDVMFGADIPQLKKLNLHRYQMRNGLDFLRRFSGLESFYLSNLTFDGSAVVLPELPKLVYVYLEHMDLREADLSALGRAGQLKSVKVNDDNLTDLSFLKEAAALEEIFAVDNQLSDLGGLEAKEALKYVALDRNLLTDISALYSSAQLDHLSADENQITDISVFAGCPELSTLSLNGNQIADISALASCDLTSLSMNHNQIADLAPLSACANLRGLYLADNQITDASPLTACEKMKYLNLGNNQITDLAFCENMLELEKLWARDNQISDLSGLHNVTQLEELRLNGNQITDISVVEKSAEHLEILVLDQNQISDLTPVGSCAKLKGLSVNENQLTNISSLKGCPELYFLSASGNEITDISALESCGALYMADLGENQIKDITALGASGAAKMALLLQNNEISDISPLYGMKDYVYLSLYNNQITDISGMSAMTGISGGSELYLDWWDGLQAADLSETTYIKPKLVDTPPDRQVNLQNAFQDARRDAGKTVGSIEYLSKDEADAEIVKVRTEARVAAGIDEKQEEESEE